jgi:MFS transporter, putative metabolite:H+ symporter
VISALPILLILWWRRSIPESPRWLLDQSRPEEAERVVVGFEEEIERRSGTPLPPAESAEVPAARSAPSGSAFSNLVFLWRGALAKVTLSTWAIWFAITFSYYGFFT